MNRKLLVIFLLMSTGCAKQPEYQWEKPDGTPQTFYQDRGYCQMIAMSGNPMYPMGFPQNQGQVMMLAASRGRENAIFESCMASKGWYQVRVN
jgi:hypothetical protein